LKNIIFIIMIGAILALVGCTKRVEQQKENSTTVSEKTTEEVIVSHSSELPTPTKYRIIPFRNRMADSYLQFLTIVDGEEVWRFIPDMTYTEVLGRYLTPMDCPTDLENNRYLWMISQSGTETNNLVGFAEQHPDISLYFVSMQKRYKIYLEREKNLNARRDTTYLK